MPPPEEEGYIVAVGAVLASILTITTLHYVYIVTSLDTAVFIILLSILSAVGFYFTLSTSVLASVSVSISVLASVLASVSLLFICVAVPDVLFNFVLGLRGGRTQRNALQIQQGVMQRRLNAVSAERNALQTQRNALAAAQRPARQSQNRNNNTTNDPQ